MTIESYEEKLTRALEEFADVPKPVVVELDRGTFVCLIGNLQLALRHPNNNGPSTYIVRRFIDDFIEAIAQSHPVAADALRRGDRPECDVRCTAVCAVWCPIHGDCTCKDRGDLNDDDCPLHSISSTHGKDL